MNWCKSHDIEYSFHNYKLLGIDEQSLISWCKSVGWEKLLNTKGTTWKKIAGDYEGVNMSENKAIEIMLQHHSVIKRPVVISGKKLIVGFDETALSTLL
jgi:Spx/MgsR family transcriptional regulator